MWYAGGLGPRDPKLMRAGCTVFALGMLLMGVLICLGISYPETWFTIALFGVIAIFVIVPIAVFIITMIAY